MNNAPNHWSARAGFLFHEEMRGLNLALAAIRKAQGNLNLLDSEPGLRNGTRPSLTLRRIFSNTARYFVVRS
jgi:hypothetical protein